MAIYISEKDMPKKTCENCPFCEYFEKDAHGKGKHEVACLAIGTFNNILYGNTLCPENCNIVKSLEQHDAEIRKQERERLIDEIKKIWFPIEYRESILEDIEKLNEMKGETK